MFHSEKKHKRKDRCRLQNWLASDIDVTQENNSTASSHWAPIKAKWKTCPNMNSTAIQRFFLHSTKILLELRFTSRSSHHIQAPLPSLQYLESSKKIHTNLLILVSWKGKEIGVEVDKQNLSLLTPHTSEFCPSYRKTVSLRVHISVDTLPPLLSPGVCITGLELTCPSVLSVWQSIHMIMHNYMLAHF